MKRGPGASLAAPGQRHTSGHTILSQKQQQTPRQGLSTLTSQTELRKRAARHRVGHGWRGGSRGPVGEPGTWAGATAGCDRHCQVPSVLQPHRRRHQGACRTPLLPGRLPAGSKALFLPINLERIRLSARPGSAPPPLREVHTSSPCLTCAWAIVGHVIINCIKNYPTKPFKVE